MPRAGAGIERRGEGRGTSTARNTPPFTCRRGPASASARRHEAQTMTTAPSSADHSHIH